MGLYSMSILLVEALSILHVHKLVWSFGAENENRMSLLEFVNGLIGSVLSQDSNGQVVKNRKKEKKN